MEQIIISIVGLIYAKKKSTESHYLINATSYNVLLSNQTLILTAVPSKTVT